MRTNRLKEPIYLPIVSARGYNIIIYGVKLFSEVAIFSYTPVILHSLRASWSEYKSTI